MSEWNVAGFNPTWRDGRDEDTAKLNTTEHNTISHVRTELNRIKHKLDNTVNRKEKNRTGRFGTGLNRIELDSDGKKNNAVALTIMI